MNYEPTINRQSQRPKDSREPSPFVKGQIRAAVERETAKLQAEVAALREDRDRLDWMVGHSAYVSHSRDGEVCNVFVPSNEDDEGHVPAEGHPQKCYYDARTAIDQARRTT